MRVCFPGEDLKRRFYFFQQDFRKISVKAPDSEGKKTIHFSRIVYGPDSRNKTGLLNPENIGLGKICFIGDQCVKLVCKGFRNTLFQLFRFINVIEDDRFRDFFSSPLHELKITVVESCPGLKFHLPDQMGGKFDTIYFGLKGKTCSMASASVGMRVFLSGSSG